MLKIVDTKLKGVKIIEPMIFSDIRGAVIKPFVLSELGEMDCDFKQSYYTLSKKNVLRGMHYQDGAAKLVYVSRGKVLDVVLDIKTREYISIELSENNHLALYIPAGFAHGYLCLEDSCFHYMQTKMWNPKEEGGIRWDSFGFDWGIENPIMLERDKNYGT